MLRKILIEEILRRIIREEMAFARPLDPPVEEVPFGVRVATEPLTHQAILEQLSPFYPQIRRVRNSATQRVSFECMVIRNKNGSGRFQNQNFFIL